MTDEALFYHRFVADVRSCANGRTLAFVTEIERLVLYAMLAPAEARDRRWADVVTAIGALLVEVDQGSVDAQRLRAFVCENADLCRGRDLAISELRVPGRAEAVVTTAGGRRYLTFTHPL